MGRLARIIAALFGAAVALAAIWTVFFVDWSRPLEAPAPTIRPVTTIRVGELGATARTFPARVRATNEATLSFQVAGVIQELPVVRGQPVERGQLLVQLDQRDFQSRVDSTRVEFEQFSEEFAAVTRAFERGAATQIELARFRAAVDRARAELDIAEKALEDATLLAPFDGRIADLFVERFEKVSPGVRILRIQGSDPIRVQINVDSARVAMNRDYDARTSHSVRFDFLPGREFAAKLAEFTTEADPTTQTFLAIFDVEPPEGVYILPGMTATLIERTADRAPDDPRGVVVPASAVAIDGVGSAYAWIIESVDPDGTAAARRRPLRIGEPTGDSIVVSEGLRAGERLVVAGVRELHEGQRVRPADRDAGAAPR